MGYITFILSYCLKTIIAYNNNNLVGKSFEFITTIVLLSVVSIFSVFILILIFFQTRSILCNQTTSEYIKSEGKVPNPFDEGLRRNISQFFCNIYGYKEKINLNESARLYLKNILITEYLNNDDCKGATELANTSSISTSTNNSSIISNNKNELL
jgi:hypothetical protein